MTFPRVHHADYFSDSGPVDGTVLVNSHSDAIEALQAEATLVADSATIGSTTGAESQFGVVTDAAYTLVAWDAGGWQTVTATDPVAETAVSNITPQFRSTFGAGTGATDGQPGFDDVSYRLYVYRSGTWHQAVANDPDSATALTTANIAAATADSLYPRFGVGNPTATSQPTDGTVINYFDTTASTYVHWVFDPNVTAFHQVAQPVAATWGTPTTWADFLTWAGDTAPAAAPTGGGSVPRPQTHYSVAVLDDDLLIIG